MADEFEIEKQESGFITLRKPLHVCGLRWSQYYGERAHSRSLIFITRVLLAANVTV
jgi:hypothetical protein